MAFRRPPRISEEKGLDSLSDDSLEGDISLLQSPRRRPLTISARDPIFVEPAVHPALTDYGPDTLQILLRAELEKARADGRVETRDSATGKQRGRRPLSEEKKPTPGFQSSPQRERRSYPVGHPSRRLKDALVRGPGEDDLEDARPIRRRLRVSYPRRDLSESSEDENEPPSLPPLQHSSNNGLSSTIRRSSRHDFDSRPSANRPLTRSSAKTRTNLNPAAPLFISRRTADTPMFHRSSDPQTRSLPNTQPAADTNPDHRLSSTVGDQLTSAGESSTSQLRRRGTVRTLLVVENRSPRNRSNHESMNADNSFIYGENDVDVPAASSDEEQPGAEAETSRKSSRNKAFEEQTNAKRRSRREDKKNLELSQGLDNADCLDDNEIRWRKSPGRGRPHWTSASQASTGPAFENHLLALHPISPAQVDTQASMTAALDGMGDEFDHRAPTFEPLQPSISPHKLRQEKQKLAPENEKTNLSIVKEISRPSTNDRRHGGDHFGYGISNFDRHQGQLRPQRFYDMPAWGGRSSRFALGDPSSSDPEGSYDSLVPSPPQSGRLLPRQFHDRGDLASSPRATRSSGFRSSASAGTSLVFAYSKIVPESLPQELYNTNLKKSARKTGDDYRTNQHRDAWGSAEDAATSHFPRHSNGQPARPIADKVGTYPRVWTAVELPSQAEDPPSCPISDHGRGWSNGLNTDLLIAICEYLSHEDVGNLRRVNRAIEGIVRPILFRSVVANFGRSFFDIDKEQWDSKTGTPPPNSMMRKMGQDINKFGMSFEVDFPGLYSAKPKMIQRHVEDWWGSYDWALPEYPRFPDLQTVEDLVDNNRPLLKNAFKNLTKASELALSIDSGHGWLEGPDISDMAIFDLRCDRGNKVFGKTFRGVNKWHEHCRNELFRWGQQNTLNESLKAMRSCHDAEDGRASEIKFLRAVSVLDRSSFKIQDLQPDQDLYIHTGGRGGDVPQGAQGHAQAQAPNPQVGNPANVQHPAPYPAQFQRSLRSHRGGQSSGTPKKGQVISPQWPLIFSGHSISAEVGGHCSWVQNKIAKAISFPLHPGELTEAQAQWLMETVWAQRAFLSAYTTAIITNRPNFAAVHSVRIAKLSSGLLPTLAQNEFWSALPALKTLTILISPDWRTEHIPGDRSFNSNMMVSPVQASIKFTEFLAQYIAKIEGLSSLTIGFVGGGEHQPGIFARNQNILPAPITTDPRGWLSDHRAQPDKDTMINFNHIRNLKFQNCWFSPCMLEGFMEKARDSSLRHLTLDSVSLTGINSSRNDGPLTTSDGAHNPRYGIQAWLQERLPNSGCWPAVLDRLSPGVTFFERKVAAGMINNDMIDRPENQRGFRGNVESITLKSCGYIKVGGISATDLNQNGLVVPNRSAIDEGIKARKAMLESNGNQRDDGGRRARRMLDAQVFNMQQQHQQQPAGPGFAPIHVPIHGIAPPPPGLPHQYVQAVHDAVESSERNNNGRIMMRPVDPSTGSEWFGLGKMTQAVHPVEKRVLEQAWRCSFGWGDDLERFKAVEDGWFEGGTGRFGGVIRKLDEIEKTSTV